MPTASPPPAGVSAVLPFIVAATFFMEYLDTTIILTVFLGSVKRRFSVPACYGFVVVRSLGQGWPKAIAEGDA